MRRISLTTVTFSLAAGMAAVLAFGCASEPQETSPGDYFFFVQYPNLTRVDAAKGVFLYVNPKKPLRSYKEYIVDPAGIYFQPGSKYWIDRPKSEELAAYLRQEIIASLSKTVVENPGPGVLRMSIALGDVRAARKSDASTTAPAGGEHQAVLRILLTDSLSGQEVLLLRDVSRGNEFTEALQQRGEAGAREVLREWAGLLRQRLDEARRTNAQTQPSVQSEND